MQRSNRLRTRNIFCHSKVDITVMVLVRKIVITKENVLRKGMECGIIPSTILAQGARRRYLGFSYVSNRKATKICFDITETFHGYGRVVIVNKTNCH